MTPEEVKTFSETRLKAELGNAEAQCNLGLCFAFGKGVLKDQVEAVKWYRKAAEQGNANAQVNLGACYAFGTGVLKDNVEAAKWIRKAAEQGDASGQFYLGAAYFSRGVHNDEAEGVKWFRKAAEQGNVSAQYILGIAYSIGHGVLKDEVESYAWINLAALTDPEIKNERDRLEKMLPQSTIEAGQKRSNELQALIEKNKAASGSK